MARVGRVARLGVTLAVTTLSVVGLATAAQAESIRDFSVDVQVYDDTAFQVVETIQYDYEGEYRHGIFRDIPQYDETLSG